MGAADDEFDLDFTVHFSNATVQTEKLPPEPQEPPAAAPGDVQAAAPAAPRNPAAEKVVLDPDFKIGISTTDGLHVAIARRSPGASDAIPGNRIMFVEDEP